MIRCKPEYTPAALTARTGLLLLAFFCGSLIIAGHASGSTPADFPDRLGKIIYRQNPENEQQIYIVAQSHRSLASGRNGSDTARVQAEIYRIGEWLIKNRAVDILLPEGYFLQKTTASDAAAAGANQSINTSGAALSDAVLLERLAAAGGFENANTLLHANYEVALCQIEDWNLYASVCRLMLEVKPAAGLDQDLPSRAGALDYQQKKRSAVLLGNIPIVLNQIEDHHKTGLNSALLTVGLAHVEEIIHFLKNGEARIKPLSGMDTEFSGYYSDLHDLTNKYGITIILPPTLAENNRLVHLFLPGT